MQFLEIFTIKITVHTNVALLYPITIIVRNFTYVNLVGPLEKR